LVEGGAATVVLVPAPARATPPVAGVAVDPDADGAAAPVGVIAPRPEDEGAVVVAEIADRAELVTTAGDDGAAGAESAGGVAPVGLDTLSGGAALLLLVPGDTATWAAAGAAMPTQRRNANRAARAICANTTMPVFQRQPLLLVPPEP
jgi:hypothetical protein